jgi:hypothetical protein
MVHTPSLLLKCVSLLVVPALRDIFFKKSPKMATFQSYARVCAVVEL